MPRPVLEIPLTRFERLLEGVCVAGVISFFGLIAWKYPQLPASVPQHFGPNGQPDAWGDKSAILVLCLIVIFLYAMLTMLSKNPHVFNYPFALNEHNIEEQYRLARTLINTIKLEIISIFLFTGWKMIQVSLGQADGLGAYFLPLFAGLLFSTIFVYLYQASKAK
jgi:uncharacterized membrane protein